MKNLYEYSAQVVRVIDGDTLDVIVDLGFNLSHKIRIRVRNINTPELNSSDAAERILAQKAKDEAMKLLPVGSTIKIKTFKDAAIYNRYEADIALSNGRDFVGEMKLAGF